MKGYAPGLFDKLMGDTDRATSQGLVTRLTLEELKDSVALDLEALLNTRTVLHEELLASFPECSNSIIAYGLNDFAGMSLASTDDRVTICRCLEKSIGRHEPRLRDVKAALAVEGGTINRLTFIITALLVTNFAKEQVSFDAVLQPSTLQYSISKGRHLTRVGM